MLKWIAASYHNKIQGHIVEKSIAITQKVQYLLIYHWSGLQICIYNSYDIFVVIVVRAATHRVFLLIVCVCKGIELGNQWVVKPQYIPLFQNTTAYPTLTTSISKWNAMKSKGIPSLLRTKINLLSVRLINMRVAPDGVLDSVQFTQLGANPMMHAG